MIRVPGCKAGRWYAWVKLLTNATKSHLDTRHSILSKRIQQPIWDELIFYIKLNIELDAKINKNRNPNLSILTTISYNGLKSHFAGLSYRGKVVWNISVPQSPDAITSCQTWTAQPAWAQFLRVGTQGVMSGEVSPPRVWGNHPTWGEETGLPLAIFQPHKLN